MAWSVTNNLTFFVYGGALLVPFPVVLVNDGNVWNIESNTANISVKGVYYVHLDIGTCPNNNLFMTVNVNNRSYFAAQFLPISPAGSTVRGQAAILSLEIGDTVSVSSPHKSQQCYNPLTTAFYGFLLSLQ